MYCFVCWLLFLREREANIFGDVMPNPGTGTLGFNLGWGPRCALKCWLSLWMNVKTNLKKGSEPHKRTDRGPGSCSCVIMCDQCRSTDGQVNRDIVRVHRASKFHQPAPGQSKLSRSTAAPSRLSASQLRWGPTLHQTQRRRDTRKPHPGVRNGVSIAEGFGEAAFERV